jgi:hypothetical protein
MVLLMASQLDSVALVDMPQNALSLAGFNDDRAENILENRRRFLKLFPGDWALAGLLAGPWCRCTRR